MNKITKKSEILFLYETSYNIPNGDPFTGEQRYDEETKKILVSDVRIKRFVRSYLEDVKNLPIYVSDKTGAGKTDSKGVLKWIAENRIKETQNVPDILRSQIDVRLFGGISTLKDKEAKVKIDGKEKNLTNTHTQFTGPVQFSLLNPSLNEVNMRMHQNTTHFTSTDEKTQGSIGTTTIVPYSIMQIHGWVNPKVAEETKLTEEDVQLMFEALWYGAAGEGTSYSRSKIGQNSVLLLEIVYREGNNKIYGIDRLIRIKNNEGKKGEQLRSMDDFDFDFTKLQEVANLEKVEKIRYYTELDSVKKLLVGNDEEKNKKFEEIKFLTEEEFEKYCGGRASNNN